jgi:glycosyltransferase involved in cell wall biosynthesis
MKRPLVSIMLPCFNAAETLRFALASLLAQTLSDWECVCLDDGSTDETASILTDAANRDARFRVERFAENRGRGAARQRILELVRGDYLAFLDADDWMYPDRLAHEVRWLEADPHIMAVTVCAAVTDGADHLVGMLRPRASHPLPAVTLFEQLAPPPLIFPASMIRTGLAQRTGFNPAFRRSQDSDFLVRALLGKHYALSSEVLYAYSKTAQSLERTFDGYRFRMRTHLSKWREQPLHATRTLAETGAKLFAYRVAGALGLEQKLIDRRYANADAETARGFVAAAAIVRRTHNEWFD